MFKNIQLILLVIILTGCSAFPSNPTQPQLSPRPTSTGVSSPPTYPSKTATLPPTNGSVPPITLLPTGTSIPVGPTTPTILPTETTAPTPTPTRHIAISPENVDRLTLLHIMDVVGGSGVDWSPDGKTIAVANETGISLFDANDLTIQKIFPIKGGAKFVLYSMDGSKLAVSDGWNWGKILDAGSGQVLHEFSSYTGVKNFCPDGKILTSFNGPA